MDRLAERYAQAKVIYLGGNDLLTVHGFEQFQHLLTLSLSNNLLTQVSDLYVLAGAVAVEEMGGPTIGFRSGRSDASVEAAPSDDSRFSPDGRLPDGDKPSRPETVQHLRDIFYRMGFDEYVKFLETDCQESTTK